MLCTTPVTITGHGKIEVEPMKATVEKTEVGYTVTANDRQFFFESIFAATLKVSELLHDYERTQNTHSV